MNITVIYSYPQTNMIQNWRGY